MFRPRVLLVPAACSVMLAAPALSAERSEIPDKYKWDLKDLFASDQEWEKAKDELLGQIPSLAAYQGKLGESAATLHEALSAYMKVSQSLERTYTYASQTFDTDTRVSHSQEMDQAMEDVVSKFRTTTSYMRPELISVGKAKIDAFVASEPRLAEYRVYLDNIVRLAPHTLSTDEEKILARAARLGSTPDNVYSIFTSSDLPYPTVKLSSGEEARLDPAGYTKNRTLANREDRLKVFHAFFQTHQDFRRTFGTALGAHMQGHLMNRDLRKYESCLEAALYGDNIPVTVYHRLVSDVNTNLPTLHRYLKLRARMMGLTDLGYEDLYAPIVKEVDMSFTPEEGTAVVLSAVKPLGEDYAKVLSDALLREGWTDWLPSTGKRAGAYSTGAYGVHPYQLLNYNGGYDDVSTLAHESGHSMHTYLSAKNQPYVTYDYPTFVAEVASTLNENLLFHDMVDGAKDDETRLFLLGNYLEGLRTTLFRQTLFAEFELGIHEMAERGESITGDGLNTLYLGLVRKYYGHDQGICKVDDLYSVEWAYIHHFYYNFYVYQYATSLIASTALANGIHEEQASGKTKHRDDYLKLLSSGSSKYPIDLLKDAGVDMTTSAPFEACMKEMNAVMDRMETILAAK